MSTNTQDTLQLMRDAIRPIEPGLHAAQKFDSVEIGTAELSPSLSSAAPVGPALLPTGDRHAGPELSRRLPRTRRKPASDFVTFDECLEYAEQHFDEVHPNFGASHTQAAEIRDFAIRYAANVAWECAAEATRRAKGIS
jgi:hypothetical protein